MRLIVEREREIQKFKPEEYWAIVATLLKIKNQKSKVKNYEFEATLIQKDGKNLDKLEIKNKQEADKILQDLNSADYVVDSVEKKRNKKASCPAFYNQHIATGFVAKI